jgi:hypothetical protein
MANVNLAKALKMKNVLVGEINRAKEIFSRENSRSELNTSKVDRAAVYADIQAKTQALVSLKAGIAKANVNLYSTLSEMAEAKSSIAYLKSLNTQDGVTRSDPRFGSSAVVETKFEAFFTQEKVDVEVAKLQKRVEELQDVADTFNAITTIAVES